jgi:alpha-L-rhamnosidase
MSIQSTALAVQASCWMLLGLVVGACSSTDAPGAPGVGGSASGASDGGVSGESPGSREGGTANGSDEGSPSSADGDAIAIVRTGGPEHLTVDDRARPLNVEGAPLFGWFPQDPDGNEVQTAYQLQVIRELDAAPIWDSGKVASSEQSYVAYAGPKLDPGSSYTWIVRSWDRSDQPSPWSAKARFDTGLGDGDWAASWIRRQVSEVDDYTLARKELTVGKSPVVRARVYVAASQQYELYLNGQLVDRGLAFSYPGEGYYQTADATSAVKAGQALAIGIIYHWYGSGQGRPAGEAGLLARVVVDHEDGSREFSVTDGTWRVRRATQWQTGAPKRNGDGGDYVEHFDARQIPGGWAEPGYDATVSPWSAPQVIGAHPAGVFTHLKGQPSRLGYENVTPVSVKTLPDGAVVADFGAIIPARPIVTFAAGTAGRSVAMSCGYQLTADGHVSTVSSMNQGTDLSFTYVEKDGAQQFRPFTYFAWRYLQISAPGETLAKDAIQAIVQHSDAPPEDAAKFASSDPTLDGVFSLVQRSALYAAQEQFLDTPTREKGQFLGDAVNDSYATMAGSRERNTTQKAMREFIASQVRYWPDGRLNAVYPNGDGARDIPDFTEMFAVWVWRYYLETGDRVLLAEAYPVLKKVADYVWSYRNATTGLITNLAGGSGQYQYGIIDWPPVSRFGYDAATTAHTTVNILAFDVEHVVSDAAKALGGAATEVDTYAQRATDLTTSINARLRRADGVYIDGLAAGGAQSTHASQHATSYAIAFGIAPTADQAALATYIAGLGMQQGPMTAHLLLKALGDSGRADQVLTRLTDKVGLGWANVLAQGGTFTWESWTARALGDSESHGWGSQAVVDILEVLLGVRVASPGAATVLISPPDGVLTSAHGTLPTQRGPVSVEWTRTAGGLTLDIDVPVNVRAKVALPHPELNPTASGAGVPMPMPAEGGRAIFEAGSGRSHFVVGG